MTSLPTAMAAIPALIAAWIALSAWIATLPSSGRTPEIQMRIFRGAALLGSALALAGVLCQALLEAVADVSPGWAADGLGTSYSLLTAAAWPAVIYLARHCDRQRPGLLYVLLLLLESTFLGLFAADDVVLVVAFLMCGTLIVYLLIGGWSRPEAEGVARKFLVFNLTAGMLFLMALVGVAVSAARISDATIDEPHGLSYSLSHLVHTVPRLAAEDIGAQEYWNHSRRWIVTALVLALAIGTPLVPFHNWFTAAVAEAQAEEKKVPTAGAACGLENTDCESCQ